MFGDFLQLRPVKSSLIFEGLSDKQKTHVFSSVVCLRLDLFEKFTFHELMENMCQKGQLDFQQLLSRCRIGSLTVEDVGSLRERMVELDVS